MVSIKRQSKQGPLQEISLTSSVTLLVSWEAEVHFNHSPNYLSQILSPKRICWMICLTRPPIPNSHFLPDSSLSSVDTMVRPQHHLFGSIDKVPFISIASGSKFSFRKGWAPWVAETNSKKPSALMQPVTSLPCYNSTLYPSIYFLILPSWPHPDLPSLWSTWEESPDSSPQHHKWFETIKRSFVI